MKLLENTRQWRKTKRGLITNLYHKMKARMSVEFSLEWLHEFSNCKKFNRLYNEWVVSDYNKQFKPSIDRINHKKVYTKNNIQWLTWAENRYKQSMERRARKGEVAQFLGDKVVKIFPSQRKAVMETSLSQSQMSKVLNGKGLTCGGYDWRYVKDLNLYENPDLLNG